MNKVFIATELVEIAKSVASLEKTASAKGKEMQKMLEEAEESTRKALGKIKKCSVLIAEVDKEPDALHHSEDFEYVLNGVQHEAELLVKQVKDLREKNKKIG